MPEKILIVDDEPDMLVLLSMIIKSRTPYEVITTSNPFEALEWAKKGGYDLVITDLKNARRWRDGNPEDHQGL